MKNYIVTFFLFFSLSACCGNQKVIDSKPKLSEEIAQVTIPGTLEAPAVIEALVVEPQKEPQKEPVVEEIKSNEDTQVETVTLQPIEAFNHTALNNLLQKHVSKQGNVNYNGFISERSVIKNYIISLGANMPNDTWTKEDKLAFWINAYNAMTIDLILRNPSVKSIKDIKDPWDQRLWKLGDKWYNLNQIEHDILRKMNEPRIHFAIVCASASCPKLQNIAFTASDLDNQLTNATKEFLSDTSKNTLSKNSVKLSKIFKWFAKDFKQNQSLIDFLNKYSDIEITQNASKSYKDYDWNLND